MSSGDFAPMYQPSSQLLSVSKVLEGSGFAVTRYVFRVIKNVFHKHHSRSIGSVLVGGGFKERDRWSWTVYACMRRMRKASGLVVVVVQVVLVICW